jgi:cation:H+ antiporter
MIILTFLIFLISIGILTLAGSILMNSLMKVSNFLGWRDFVVAFLLVSLGTSLPDLLLGVSSALRGVPQLSFGDVVGGNIVDFTLVIALAVLVGGNLPTKGSFLQSSILITSFVSILPLILIFDKTLSRLDGILLILCFLFYVKWLFTEKKNFLELKDSFSNNAHLIPDFTEFLKGVFGLILGFFLLLFSADSVVKSAISIAQFFALPIAILGILLTGLGNSLPELYFAILAARKKGSSGLILGDVLGSVVFLSTLILGIVALIQPIQIVDFSPFLIARFILILTAVLFFIFSKTNQVLSRREALILILIYFIFAFSEIFNQMIK